MQTILATSPADTSAGTAFGANRLAPQPGAAPDARRFAELLQDRREARPQTTAHAEPKPEAPPNGESAAKPARPLSREAPDNAGDRSAAQGAENAAADASSETACAASKAKAADKDAARARPSDPPTADAPLPPGAAATPGAPGADPTFWSGMPVAAAQDALAAGGDATLELRIGAGGATAVPGSAGNPAAGGAADAARRGTSGQSSGDARGDAAADQAAALLAAAATDSKTTAAAGAAGERFALPARAAEATLPGWAGGVALHRTQGDAPTSVALPTPLAAPDFAKALGAQVSVFARNGLAQAELQLTPAEMGPIRVQIAIDGAHARVDFAADSAATRQVIERGLPELAAALREQGLTLSGGGVFQRAPDQNDEPTDGQPAPGRARRRAATRATDAIEPPARSRARSSRPGGVDLYA